MEADEVGDVVEVVAVVEVGCGNSGSRWKSLGVVEVVEGR